MTKRMEKAMINMLCKFNSSRRVAALYRITLGCCFVIIPTASLGLVLLLSPESGGWERGAGAFMISLVMILLRKTIPMFACDFKRALRHKGEPVNMLLPVATASLFGVLRTFPRKVHSSFYG